MRSKTVRCAWRHDDYAQLEKRPAGEHIELEVRESERFAAILLTPHRARELGKALIQMADEKEKAEGK